MPFVYVPVTIGIYRGDVHLTDFDCEARVDYELPDGPSGVLDWDVTGFHFASTHNGKAVYTEIGKTDALWRDLYDHMDREWVHDQAREMLAADGICNLYLGPDA
jgi:hypothetical protein